MSHWISLITPHGRMNAWSAEPDDKPNGGIVIVPDVLGVNSDLISISGMYAQEGYLTLVPALFDKVQREVELDDTEANRIIGQGIAAKLGSEAAKELVHTTADAIAHAGKVALIGYGWGAKVALEAAGAWRLPCIAYYDSINSVPTSPTEPALTYSREGNGKIQIESTLSRTLDFLSAHIRHEND